VCVGMNYAAPRHGVRQPAARASRDLPEDTDTVGGAASTPTPADTPWLGRLRDRADNPTAERVALEARQPHGRFVSAEEVADAVAYLASPRSGSMSETSIAVDGGMQDLRLRSTP